MVGFLLGASVLLNVIFIAGFKTTIENMKKEVEDFKKNNSNNDVYIVTGLDNTNEDILGVYNTETKANNKRTIEDKRSDYTYVSVSKFEVE